MKSRNVILCVLIVSLLAFLFLSGCGKKEKGTVVKNRPPRVRVSGGPPQGGVSNYTVPIYWFGWDDDGVVDHFLYAIDDTTSWIETRFFQGSFLFTADSVRAGEDFGRWHTFWIKAIDNDGDISYPDYLTFDARTVAPKTTILSPSCDPTGSVICQGPRPVGLSVKIVWKGIDPDSRDPRQLPVAYQWRLFNLTKAGLPQGCSDENTCVQFLDSPPYVPDSTSVWSEPTTQTEIRFTNLQAGSFWLFGVRAIDEAGAVEPYLHLWGNTTYFKTMPGYGIPTLTICEGSSCHEYPSDGPVWEREAPVNKQLLFTWYGDASQYGGTIAGYTYGVDIEDLNDPSQWEGWSAEVKSASVIFHQPGVHYFYVKVRDYADAEAIGIVQLDIIAFLFDRDILYVDDYFDLIPGDLDHDTFVSNAFASYHTYSDTMYVFNYYHAGPGGIPREITSAVEEPALAELTRYKVIVWDCYGPTSGFDVGLNRVVSKSSLDVYIKGGGRLFLYGVMTLRSTDLRLNYPTDMSDPNASWLRDTFVYKYIKISGAFDRAFYRTTNKGDGFRGTYPNRKISNAIPILDVDTLRAGVSQQGLWMIEAVTSAMQEPSQSQRPDTLFFYHSNYPTSPYNKLACGLRFFDPYSNSKVVWLGFPIQYFYPQQAESLGAFVLNWMFEDLTPSRRPIALR